MLINRASDTFGRPVGFTLFPLHLGEGQGEGKPQYSVAYAYDEFGRFASVSSSASLANLAVQYSYLPNTDIIAGYTSGDFTRTVAYEPARSLITAMENKFGNATISCYEYTNDELGRRTAIARSGNAFGDIPVTDSYGYNLRSEVTSARRTLSAAPAQTVSGFSHDYAYDPIGNRIAATNNQEAMAYAANSLNQYTAVNEIEPVYDDDGNLLSDGRFNYTWNGENRLVMASNNMHVSKYAYDHQGRMVWKQIASANAPTKTITYTWDDFNIVAEHEIVGSTDKSTYNIWGLDLSGSLQGAGGVGGLLAVSQNGAGVPPAVFLPCYDANGNVTEYITDDGTIAAHYEYSPFGEIAVQAGSLASTFTHRFSTKPWCPVTGFSEYEYRKYSPKMGRWLSRDPIGEEGGENQYLFCLNDIMNKIDPYGLKIRITNHMDFNARTTSSGARGEVGHHLKISVGCSWWGFGSELVVKGEFTLKMIVLAPSDPKWALRYPRYNKKWGVNRSNAGERNATIAHEKDHWQTYIAFEDILKVLNVMEGRKCCPCSKFVVALQAKVKSIHAAAVKHSREFDDVAWWDGGNYAKRPFVPDALPTCK